MKFYVTKEHVQIINQSTQEEAGINKALPHLLSQHPSTTPSPYTRLGLPQYRGEYSGFGQNYELGALPWTASQIRINITLDFMYV